MENESKKYSKTNKEIWEQNGPLIGIVLIASGLMFLLDQRLQTGWLSLAIPVIISIILLTAGIVSKRRILLIPGFIGFGVSSAFFLIFQNMINLQTDLTVGFAIGVFGLSWFFLVVSLLIVRKIYAWWALFVAFIAIAVSICFFLTNFTFLNFLFAISLATGSVFILWGMINKQLGLIMPGLLVSTIGAGVFFAWSHHDSNKGLQETGTMLVWFALGWILITVISRIYSNKFVWWPLIPGGVLTMVGTGLYIGGNPGNALGFFQNTGSIGLIMFGVYLILLKYGMNK